jgi:phenylacetaldehyde dehydrogenase
MAGADLTSTAHLNHQAVAGIELSAVPSKALIGGQWVPALSGKTFETLDPATGEPLASVALGAAEDIDRAVTKAVCVQLG